MAVFPYRSLPLSSSGSYGSPWLPVPWLIPWHLTYEAGAFTLFQCFLCMAGSLKGWHQVLYPSDSPHCLLPAPSTRLQYGRFSNPETDFVGTSPNNSFMSNLSFLVCLPSSLPLSAYPILEREREWHFPYCSQPICIWFPLISSGLI